MENKTIGTILIIGAVLYFVFTGFIVGHGIHPLNTFGAIIALTLGIVIFFQKKETEIIVQAERQTAELPSAAPTVLSSQKVKIFFVSLAFGLLSAIIIALRKRAKYQKGHFGFYLSFLPYGDF